MKLMGFPAEVRWTVRELRPERLLDIRGKGPMGVTLVMRYALEPDGGATTVRIDGEFTGAAVSLMAGKLKDSASSALQTSLSELAAGGYPHAGAGGRAPPALSPPQRGSDKAPSAPC